MLEKLRPWKGVIGESAWRDLLLKQVIPKIQYYLDNFEINPAEQKGIEEISSVVAWCNEFEEVDVCSIMEDTILVKIAEILMEWISSVNEEGEEEETYEKKGEIG